MMSGAVYIPPSTIATYDGGKDNWSWPQHNGDFALLRIYSDKKGASEYFDTKHIYNNPSFVSVASSPERDNVLAIGYPDSTYRHATPNCYISNYLSIEAIYDFLLEVDQMSLNGSTHAIFLKISYITKKNIDLSFLSDVESIQFSKENIDELQTLMQEIYLLRTMYTHTDWLKRFDDHYGYIDKYSKEDLQKSYWLLELASVMIQIFSCSKIS